MPIANIILNISSTQPISKRNCINPMSKQWLKCNRLIHIASIVIIEKKNNNGSIYYQNSKMLIIFSYSQK